MAYLEFTERGKTIRRKFRYLVRKHADGRISKPVELPDGDTLILPTGITERTLTWVDDKVRVGRTTKGDRRRSIVLILIGVWIGQFIELLAGF